MNRYPHRFAVKSLAVAIIVVSALLAVACGGKKPELPEARLPAKTKYKIGLVTSFGGLNDQSFNDMHFNGMMMAKKQFDIEFEYATPVDDKDYATPAENLIQKGCNVIVAGASFYMIDTVDQLSAKYPGIIFILDDAQAKTYRSNVTSISYMQNQGSFLAGALAAKVSATKKIAVIAAANVPVINDFMVGYKAGALYADPSVMVTESYIQDRITEGSQETYAWNAPRLAKAMALELFAANVDVIFQVASGSGMGIFIAAQEKGKYAIGVDSDQDYLVEGSILTSMMKNVDQAMVFIIGEILGGTITNQNYTLGLKEGGVGLSKMKYTKSRIPAEVLDYVDRLKDAIIAGSVTVPSAF